MGDFLFGIVCAICVVVVLVIAYRRRPVSAKKAAGWPETEGTIQSVNQVMIGSGRSSYLADVADFSYKVNGDFYSGRATVLRGYSAGDRSSKELVDCKVRVLYDSQEPESFSFPKQQVGDFSLVPYAEGSGTDVDPIDLNIA